MCRNRLAYQGTMILTVLLALLLLAIVPISPIRAQGSNLQLVNQPTEPVEIKPNEVRTLTFTLNNAGDGPATGVRVQATLPPGFTLVRENLLPQQPLPMVSEGAVSWEFGEIASLQSIDFVVSVQAQPDTQAGSFEVRVAYSSAEPPGDASISIPMTILEEVPSPGIPQLQLVNQPTEPVEIKPNEVRTLTFTLNNAGDGPATGVRVQATLPPGFTLVRENLLPQQPLPMVSEGAVSWEFPQIDPQQSIDFVVSVQAQPDVQAGPFEVGVAYSSAEPPGGASISIPMTILEASFNIIDFITSPIFTIITILVLISIALIVVGLFFGPLKRRQAPPPPSRQPVAPPPAVPYLEYATRTTGPQKFRLNNLDKSGEMIGRAMPEEGITLRIDDKFPGWETVSRHHARIFRDQNTGRVVIQDNNSQNGVYVNGRRTLYNALKDGWPIRIGGVEFIYREGQERHRPAPVVKQPRQ